MLEERAMLDPSLGESTWICLSPRSAAVSRWPWRSTSAGGPRSRTAIGTVLPNSLASIASAREEGVPGTARDIGASRFSRPPPRNASTTIAAAQAIRIDHDRRFGTAPAGSRRLIIAGSWVVIVAKHSLSTCLNTLYHRSRLH